MRCRQCDAENPAQARFCLNCGAKLVAVCPQCGIELLPEAKFCTACGASLAAPRPNLAGDALRRLVPTEYAERLLATRGRTARERRLVTILFSDIKGYSTLAEKMDPEDVLDVVNGAFEFLIPPIYRYEGTLTQMMGDAILAFFGAPIAHEDDPERACRAALEIIAGSREYAARLERERGIHGFAVRVGMHTGLVVTGEVGTDLRTAYTAVGDSINLAARMESAAEPGTVLMTGETHRLIAPLFETQALGPVEVKNRAEPVPVYRLLGARAGHGKAYGIRGLESPLVGRDGELVRLQEALERLRAGVGGIVTIVGEAGLGKSRLVAEVRSGAAPTPGPSPSRGGEPLQWIEGRCLSYGGIAYLLWLDVLRQLLGVTEEQAPTEVLERLHATVQDLCPERYGEVYLYLARLLSLPLKPEDEVTLHELGAEQLKAATFQAVETLLECAAHRQPLVLVCEDLHWADPTSLELLERVLALCDRGSLLLICVLRPERSHGCWRVRQVAGRDYAHRHSDLRLAPLTERESESLVSNLLGVEGLPPDLRRRVLERAEGNPFYVEEIIRALIDGGAIACDEASGQWRATRDVAEIAIPETLQGALAARIDRLQEDTRRVLRMASVIGRTFLQRVLAEIAEEERNLDRHLVTLQREEMIRERARLPELEYIFKHYLTQEAAYNGLLKRERRAYHRQVAEALERLYPGRLEELAGLLAHHWERAEAPEQAVHYLLQAGDGSRMLYAHEEATGFYERALALVRQQGDPELTARTLLKLGLTYHTAFDYARARAAYDEGFSLWRQVAVDAPSLPPASEPLRMPSWLPWRAMDPQIAWETFTIWAAAQLFRGLVELTPELDVVPDLAERWEVLEGGRRYLFHLRRDVTWSDGTPLTAADVAYSWRRLLDPATASLVAPFLFALKNGRAFHEGELTDPAQLGVRAEDAHTLAVELEEPAGHFLTVLTCCATYAVPRKAVEAHGAAWAEPGRIVTSGPFCLESWEAEGQVIMVRNPEYRGRRRGNVERLELTYLPPAFWQDSGRWSELLAMYDAGDQHGLLLLGVPGGELARRGGEYFSVPGLCLSYVEIATDRAPLDDARVRRALAMAIDRSALSWNVSGFSAQATGGFVPPGMPGHSPGIGLPFDLAQARRLLAEAGYPDGRGFPRLQLLTTALYGDLAPSLQAQWREHLGIDSAWEAEEGSMEEMLERWQEGTVDACTLTWAADYPDPQNFLSVGIRTNGRWRHGGYERLVAAARCTFDQAERSRLYQQADRLLVQEAAIVPLGYHRQPCLVKPWAKLPVNKCWGFGAMKDAVIEPH